MNDTDIAELSSVLGAGDVDYTVIPRLKSETALLKLCVTYRTGYIQYHNYTDIHPWLFSPSGDRLLFTAAYTPPIIFAGRNLLELERCVKANTLLCLPVYRRGYHKPITDKEAPVITAAYYIYKEAKETVVREAVPEIPELPELRVNQG